MQIESHKWARVKELFEAALDREPTKRAAFLAEACAGDNALRREVESLLAFDAGGESFIERPAYETAAELFADEEDEHEAVGRRFGAYTVIREIGRGGMGAVYLAERADDEYQKQVAIKIVKRGMDTDFVLRRFRQERQILAQLDHPHIARLLEGGTTDDGLPYFVMEYVEGTPINDYADAHKLSTLERLALFRTVCSAVSYAHRNLVVHRDLKPSNILVTSDGVPKLLDFGIAKLLDTNAATHTMTALVAMTPEYASPEQVRGQPVTTSSDVYSLGVVLYELLSGHRPFRLANRRPDEIARVVCEEEPERPSTALLRMEEITNADGAARMSITPERVSERREESSPEHLRRQLTGDLDNIVLMAIRKEPERRYSSVGQLSEDIRRHLEGLPVIARKDTFKYRAEKFIRRNKGSVAAAALVVLSLIMGVAVALNEAHRATVQARIAAEQCDAAERARERAEKVSRFMQSFLDYANPNWHGRGNDRLDVTVREAIDDAAARIDTEIADAPEVRADLHYTIGEVYRTHGEYERSLRH
ncbi:MAG: serine/threonine protein kinase, partial [Acidobacteriota bacterium]|nr:serine/threonine protein kinase [Acidobacteriota bacterium]